jgi:hypothetical protein
MRSSSSSLPGKLILGKIAQRYTPMAAITFTRIEVERTPRLVGENMPRCKQSRLGTLESCGETTEHIQAPVMRRKLARSSLRAA